jgi:hypothetical protein
MMNSSKCIRTLATAAVLGLPAAFAQPSVGAATPLSRENVRAETVEFLRTHKWDEGVGSYVPKTVVAVPSYATSRAEIRSQTESFLKLNRWEEEQSAWVPRAGAERQVTSTSRAQVKEETRQFLRTHKWDDAASGYVERPVSVER